MSNFEDLWKSEMEKLGGHDLARERIAKVKAWFGDRVGEEYAKGLMQSLWTATALEGFENLIAGADPETSRIQSLADKACMDQLLEVYASNHLKIVPRDPPDFYQTSRWRRLRYQALKANGSTCQCCGEPAKPPHVDHIKPRSKYPKLEYEISNLQVLCRSCNSIKSDNDETDWR